MNRRDLDALLATAPAGIHATQIEEALTVSGNKPTAHEWRGFGVRVLLFAGVAALAAALIFFIAANWQSLRLLGRFALVQILLLIAIGVAWWCAPHPAEFRSADAADAGRRHHLFTAAMAFAVLATGALFALFGQTYQTGADIYELFFIWAALTLPFALAAMSGAVWAIWVVILNVGMALFCGWGESGAMRWTLRIHFGVQAPVLLMLPVVLNLAGAWFAHRTHENTTLHAQFRRAAPEWLQRGLLTIAFLYATNACLMVMPKRYSGDFRWGGDVGDVSAVIVFFIYFIACALTWWITHRARRDVYPLALVIASAIVISTAFIVQFLLYRMNIGNFFLTGVWLIGASTAAGFFLMRRLREWRTAPQGDAS